ncbi:formate--tetrahydrofolate ligase [Sansalvadorimonas sp. 2012CJ34-2]|uniref:Formate--tetrahydrofolate ligase n=1 Tax=Parendozoicomonas callyspongiae TaxID=2942213 RepID=A0ABT0PCE9_9GAMM|nr:formate--tetrahydrofolate ligase [Sansalvadorimonas sp. 2012CJ34-2]
MKSDIEISRDADLMHITELANNLGLKQEHCEPYGHYKAKVSLDSIEDLKDRPDGRMVLVTATTPTPFGEGKTVNTIAITMGLNTIGKNAISCIRQPSMGPVFGIKGGAAGGGYAQVVPMEDFNLHLTGDIHAISSAHNLGSAALDTRIFHEEREGYEAFEKRTGLKALRIDPKRITWRRVVDHNDRALRHITVGEQTPGTPKNMNGVPRTEGFDITVGSELMAILALATSLKDMRERFGKVIMAYNHDGEPVTAEDLQVAGSMAVIMKEALKPTLMQNLEGGASFVHAGPFANIAHGNSSIVADKIALKLGDYVVTEAGFGSDMGYEKYCNIKVRAGGKSPDVVAIVCSLRGLKSHSGDFQVVAGRDLDPGMIDPNLPALEKGVANLHFHINNVKKYGVPAVVTINRFPQDTQEELDWLMAKAKELGAEGVAISEGFIHGGEGCMNVAKEIDRVCNEKKAYFNYLYNVEDDISTKLNELATKGYGGNKVVISELAQKQIADLEAKGYGNLPVCMAKTQLSVSHDPALKGEPTDFDVPVREVRLSAGAGFVYALCGTIMTMPGLGSKPGYMKIDLDDDGNIMNLS